LEQLTQMELLQLRELLSMEALAVKKCQVYARESQDAHLRQLLEDTVLMHQSQVDNLMTQLRTHNGKRPQATEH
jgi:hypothetical protein